MSETLETSKEKGNTFNDESENCENFEEAYEAYNNKYIMGDQTKVVKPPVRRSSMKDIPLQKFKLDFEPPLEISSPSKIKKK